jgi:curved DNA-binding protein CbpA
MPFDAVATHFTFTDERRFAWTPWASPYAGSLKLSPKDTRLVQALRELPTFDALCARTGMDTEAAMRRLYAFAVMGLVHFADELPEVPATQVAVPEAVVAPEVGAAPEAGAAVAPQTPEGLPFADEDEAARDALLSAFLAHRGKDPIDLLGVPVDVLPVALRKAFLALADRFSPVRFQTSELKEKAEALLTAYARAYGALSEHEQRELWLKRRRAAEEKRRGGEKASTIEQFRIRTDLLDAGSQLEEGKQRLAQENYRGALEYFEYACDIDPRPLHRAYRAWARYLVNPVAHGRLVLGELEDVLRADSNLELGHFWCGEVHRGLSNPEAAEAAYRRAFKLNPGNRRSVELLQELSKRTRR